MRRNNGDETRARVLISGSVQGVFFRGSTQEKAESLDLVGWVTNLPDGRVEAVFEGSSDAVREMISWCETGPPHASVSNVETSFETPSGDFTAFEVR